MLSYGVGGTSLYSLSPLQICVGLWPIFRGLVAGKVQDNDLKHIRIADIADHLLIPHARGVYFAPALCTALIFPVAANEPPNEERWIAYIRRRAGAVSLQKHDFCCLPFALLLLPPPPPTARYGELCFVSYHRLPAFVHVFLIPTLHPPSRLRDPHFFCFVVQLYTLVQHVEVASIKGLQTENYDQA